MFNNSVYDVRISKGFTLKRLSSFSGVSVSHINNIENGNHVPTCRIMCMLSQALGVKCYELCKW